MNTLIDEILQAGYSTDNGVSHEAGCNCAKCQSKKSTQFSSKEFETRIKLSIGGIQKILNKLGYGKLKVDGDLGRKTKAAVKLAQKWHCLKVDGKPGKNTQAKLIQEMKGDAPPYRLRNNNNYCFKIPGFQNNKTILEKNGSYAENKNRQLHKAGKMIANLYLNNRKRKRPGLRKIIFVGHTDKDGTRSYNYKLGLKRAELIRNELLEHFVYYELFNKIPDHNVNRKHEQAGKYLDHIYSSFTDIRSCGERKIVKGPKRNSRRVEFFITKR